MKYLLLILAAALPQAMIAQSRPDATRPPYRANS
jgi:hypothetical protein